MFLLSIFHNLQGCNIGMNIFNRDKTGSVPDSGSPVYAPRRSSPKRAVPWELAPTQNGSGGHTARIHMRPFAFGPRPGPAAANVTGVRQTRPRGAQSCIFGPRGCRYTLVAAATVVTCAGVVVIVVNRLSRQPVKDGLDLAYGPSDVCRLAGSQRRVPRAQRRVCHLR